jgi:hypothetical protein
MTAVITIFIGGRTHSQWPWVVALFSLLPGCPWDSLDIRVIPALRNPAYELGAYEIPQKIVITL